MRMQLANLIPHRFLRQKLAAQAVFVVQLAEDDGRGGIYMSWEAERGALGDGYRPTCPAHSYLSPKIRLWLS